MQRRKFVTSVLAGGLLAPKTLDAHSAKTTAQGEQHDHTQVEGPLATATVSFGAWPPFDRMNPPTPPGAPPPNVHRLTPYTVTIKLGGTVNFIVGGYHNIAVYAPGKELDDVNVNALLTLPGVPQPLIDDGVDRVFRGTFGPVATFPQDRVEVVQFTQPGTHLVICAFRPHFVNDKMHGWVKVVA